MHTCSLSRPGLSRHHSSHRNMEPLGSELVRQSAASYERTFWNSSTDENGNETIVRDRRVQSFPEYLEIEDGCTLGLQQGEQV